MSMSLSNFINLQCFWSIIIGILVIIYLYIALFYYKKIKTYNKFQRSLIFFSTIICGFIVLLASFNLMMELAIVLNLIIGREGL